MASSRSFVRPSPPAEAASEPEPKRRKIRKGTQSCWECKRRKTRCIYSRPDDATCDGCGRRGTSCISQEFPDQPDKESQYSNRQIVERLSQVEALVGELVKHAATVSGSGSEASGTSSSLLPSEGRDAAASNGSPGVQVWASNGDLRVEMPTPISSRRETPLSPSKRVPHTRRRISLSQRTPTVSVPKSITPKYHDIAETVRGALPSYDDLDAILRLPIDASTEAVFRGIACLKPTIEEVRSPRDILDLPPPGSHPVKVAKAALILAVFLQGIPSHSTSSLNIGCDEVMANILETTHGLVTSNDDLVASIDGVGCLFIESLFQNYAGNLRRSWLAIRRAVTMAQLLGLHEDQRSEPWQDETNDTTDPAHLWFRIVQMDRYLSLMLGVPQGCFENSFASPEKLQSCSRVEKMHRLTCAASGKLLKRSYEQMRDIQLTREIDKMLKEATEVMPPQWWLVPRATPVHDTQAFRETLRYLDQLTHHHLILQLHMPYLLDPSPHAYSKMMALTASREVLSRYIIHRPDSTARSYCRGVNYLVLISCTALCIAHIAAHQTSANTEESFNGDFLAHQRTSDRGLMECCLEGLEPTDDSIANKVASLIRYLLGIEAEAATGVAYSCTIDLSSPMATSVLETENGCTGRLSETGDELNLYIPYLGKVKIARESGQDYGFELGTLVEGQEWALPDTDLSLFDTLMQEPVMPVVGN